MYDARNEAHEFVADNRDEAVRKACDFFGVETGALTIGEFPEGEVYGLGGRAVIVAALRDRKPPSPGRGSGREGRRDEGGRGEGRRGNGRRDEGGRGERGGERGRRGGRGRREASDRDAERPAASPPAAKPEEAPAEPSVGTAEGELGELGAFLLGVIERMAIGSFEISESSEDDLLVFGIKGSAARRLSSGEGRTVDAIALLANQVAKSRELGATRVVLDVEGNEDAREDFLADLASRAAGRARKTGRAVALDPMNGKDRRTIHMALADAEDVATMSVGEGRYRQVVIVPEGAPEYERAREESEDAQRSSES
jgi:spoIIIJ-associated protein